MRPTPSPGRQPWQHSRLSKVSSARPASSSQHAPPQSPRTTARRAGRRPLPHSGHPLRDQYASIRHEAPAIVFPPREQHSKSCTLPCLHHCGHCSAIPTTGSDQRTHRCCGQHVQRCGSSPRRLSPAQPSKNREPGCIRERSITGCQPG